MKKIMIAIGLLALCCVAASAAPVKTSKAVPLTDQEMASVKGQATLYVYVWNGSNYVLQLTQGIGYTGYAVQNVYSGGPLNYVEYVGFEAPPPGWNDPPNWYLYGDFLAAGGYLRR